MASMTTALTVFSNNGNTRTSTVTGHTVSKPKLVIEKRRVPANNQSMAEYSCKVVFATVDADGLVMTQKDSIEIIVRTPVLGATADRDAAVAIARDIIAGDQFATSVATGNWLT